MSMDVVSQYFDIKLYV